MPNSNKQQLTKLIISCMLMSTAVNFSIIAYPKIFDIFGIKTTCGAFFFPLAYSISDYIGYEFGKNIARTAYVVSIGLDILFSLLSYSHLLCSGGSGVR